MTAADKLKTGIQQLRNPRAAGPNKDAQWLIYAIGLVVVIVVTMIVLARAAGVQEENVGLAVFSAPASVKTHVDAAIASILVQERVAAALAPKVFPLLDRIAVVGTPAPPEDPWAIVNNMAAAVTSEPARTRLSTRLVARINDACQPLAPECDDFKSLLAQI